MKEGNDNEQECGFYESIGAKVNDFTIHVYVTVKGVRQ